MPELPDVEVFRRYLDATAMRQVVERVEVEDPDLLEGVSGQALNDRMAGRELRSSRRHGKYLFVEVAEEGWLVVHFGMTGFLKYFKREEAAPGHMRLRLELANGYALAYSCQRKFGRVGWTGSVEGFAEEKDLGPDPLAPGFDLEALRGRLGGRRGAVKSTLMNQKVLAGLGNVYSDEILFQAGVHPERPVPDLTAGEVEELYRCLSRVVDAAIAARVEPHRLPPGYLLPHREEGDTCPRCGVTLRKKKVSGRNAYFCGKHQR